MSMEQGDMYVKLLQFMFPVLGTCSSFEGHICSGYLATGSAGFQRVTCSESSHLALKVTFALKDLLSPMIIRNTDLEITLSCRPFKQTP